MYQQYHSKQVTPQNNTSYASPEGLTNYYIIKKGNLVETQSKNGNVIFTDDTIITYKVTILNSILKLTILNKVHIDII